MDKKLRICVYMIHKNEADKAIEAITSAQDADDIYVFDTGSTNEEIEKLLAISDNALWFEYGELHVNPWRFDVARNAALAHLPGDVDVCVALDADEVLAPGWRQEIERCWEPGTTLMKYMYDWSQGMTFMQAKIHSRHGYHWVYPCHERLHYYAIPNNQVIAQTDKFMMYHHPDLTKERKSYLPLLLQAYREYPTHAQIVFYYGRELWKYAKVSEKHKERAEQVLCQYLNMKDEKDAETSYAWRILGDMLDNEEYFQKSIEHAPTHREPYIWYADWLYSKGRYEEAIDQTHNALEINERTNDYTVESRCWDGYPWHLISWCFYHARDKHKDYLEQCIDSAEFALKLEPNNEDYKKALEYFRNGETELPSVGMDKVEKEATGA